jgi:ATP-dependent DNA ligase
MFIPPEDEASGLAEGLRTGNHRGMEWGRPSRMRRSPGFIEPRIPTLAKAPPAGDGWLYEIKHDGYRLVVRRTGKRVRIYTRRGYDWTERFPRIVDAVAGLRADSIVLDGKKPPWWGQKLDGCQRATPAGRTTVSVPSRVSQ